MDEKAKFLKIALTTPKDFEGEPVPLVPFADWDYYYTIGLIDWKPDDPAAPVPSVKVPSGFVTDLTSVPRPFCCALIAGAPVAFAVFAPLYWVGIGDAVTTYLEANVEDPIGLTARRFRAVDRSGERHGRSIRVRVRPQTPCGTSLARQVHRCEGQATRKLAVIL